jgi:hypothetical protein
MCCEDDSSYVGKVKSCLYMLEYMWRIEVITWHYVEVSGQPNASAALPWR